MYAIIAILCLLLLTGCGSKGYWLIPNHLTQEQFQQDNYQCNYQAQALAFSSGYQHYEFGGLYARNIRNRVYFDCMKSKGYVWQK